MFSQHPVRAEVGHCGQLSAWRLFFPAALGCEACALGRLCATNLCDTSDCRLNADLILNLPRLSRKCTKYRPVVYSIVAAPLQNVLFQERIVSWLSKCFFMFSLPRDRQSADPRAVSPWFVHSERRVRLVAPPRPVARKFAQLARGCSENRESFRHKKRAAPVEATDAAR